MNVTDSTYYLQADTTQSKNTIRWMSMSECDHSGFLYEQHFWSETTERSLPRMSVQAHTRQAFHNDLIICLLLFCFALVCYVMHTSRKHLRQWWADFVFPRRQQKDAEFNDNLPHPSFYMFILLVAASALMCFIYMNERLYITYFDPLQPIVLFSTLLVFWILYFILRQTLHFFVMWIFFKKRQRKLWMLQHSFVTVLEGLLFFVAITASVLLSLTFSQTVLLLLISVLLSKVALTYKAKHIFFSQRYGYLHLILYLCALEIAPLLVAMKLVVLFSEELTTL